MFRIFHRTVNLFGNVLKYESKLYFDQRYNWAIIKLPELFVNKVFYSNGKFQVKSYETNFIYFTIISESRISAKNPLTNLISKNEQQQPVEKENRSEDDEKKKRDQSWRKMKYTLMAFGATFSALGFYLIIELGRPKIGEDGEKIIDQFSSYPLWKQYILRMLSEMEYYKNVCLA